MTQIKFRRDTSANWTKNNPVLGQGEPAYETDTKKFKIGDGTTKYTELPYKGEGGGGSTTPENMVTTDTPQTITGKKTIEYPTLYYGTIRGGINFTSDDGTGAGGSIRTAYPNDDFRFLDKNNKEILRVGRDKLTFTKTDDSTVDLLEATKNVADLQTDVDELVVNNSTLESKVDGISEVVNSHTTSIENLSSSKQNKLVQGNNITLKENTDGTVTISSSGGGGSTPTNMVTTDTEQVITGDKSFTKVTDFTKGLTVNSTLRMTANITDNECKITTLGMKDLAISGDENSYLLLDSTGGISFVKNNKSQDLLNPTAKFPIGYPIWTLEDKLEDDEIWLEGQVVRQNDYPKLYAIYGHNYDWDMGAYSPTDFFQLPDFRNRVAWGSDSLLNSSTNKGYLDEQLPNITGSLRTTQDYIDGINNESLSATKSTGRGAFHKDVSQTNLGTISFDASKSSTTYTDNGIVRPASILHRVKTRFK